MTTVSLLQNFCLYFDLSTTVPFSTGNELAQGSLGLLSPESQFMCADLSSGNSEPSLTTPLRHALLITHPVLDNTGDIGCHLEEYHPVQTPAAGVYDVMLCHSPRVFVEPESSDHKPQTQGLMALVQHYATTRQTQHIGCAIEGNNVFAVMGPSSPPPQITAEARDMALKSLIDNPYERCYAMEPGPKEIEGPVQIEAKEEASSLVDEAMLFYSYLRGNAATGIEQSFQKAADLLFTSRNLEHVMSILECEVDGERIIPEGVIDYFWPHLLAHTTELGLACAFFTEMLRNLDLSFAAAWLVDVLERMPDPAEHRVQRAAQFLNGLVEQGQNVLVNACFGKAYELTHTSLVPQRDTTLIQAHALLFVAYGEVRYIKPLNVQPDWHGEFVTCDIKQDKGSSSPADQTPTIRERLFQAKKAKAFVEHVPQSLRKYFTTKARESLGSMLIETRSYASIQCFKRLVMNAEQYESDPRSRTQLKHIMRADVERLGLKVVFSKNRFIIGLSDENGDLLEQMERAGVSESELVSPLVQAVSERSSMIQDVRFGYIDQIRKALLENDHELAQTLLFSAYHDPVLAIDRIAIALTSEELALIFSHSTPQKLTRFLMQGLGILEQQTYDMTDQQAMSERLKIIMPALALIPLQAENNGQGLTLENYLTYLLIEKKGMALGMTLLTGHLYIGHEGSARLEIAYEHVREGQPWFDLYRVIVSGRLLPDDLVLLRQGARMEDRVLVLLDRIMRAPSRFAEVHSLAKQERLYRVLLNDLNHLYTLLKEEKLPFELKELCAKIIVQFMDGPSNMSYHREDHATQLAKILGELTGLFDGELGMWVDYYAPAEPTVAKQIAEYGNTFIAELGSLSSDRSEPFEALAVLIQKHDRNSWLALQTLLETIDQGIKTRPFLKPILMELVRTYLSFIDLSGMIVRGIKFYLLPVMTKELAQQIYDGHGSFKNINFSNLDMSGLQAPHADFENADLRDTTWDGADISQARFTGQIKLQGACFSGAKIPRDLSRVFLDSIDLQGISLQGINLIGAKLPNKLEGVDFSGAIIDMEQLIWIRQHRGSPKGAVLSRESLVGISRYNNLDLRGVQLPEDLTDIQFYGAKLDTVQIKWIIEHKGSLAGIDLQRVNLSGMDLSGQDLSGADLTGAKLQRTILRGTNLVGAKLPQELGNVDFGGAIIDLKQLIWIRQHSGLHQGVVLSRKTLISISNYHGFDLRGVQLPEDLTDIKFYGAMLDADQIQWIIEHRGSLAGVMIGRAELEFILSIDKTKRPALRNVLLGTADLSGMDLTGQDLSGADLREVTLQATILRGTTLSGVKLPTNLKGADFTGALISLKQLRWIQNHGGSIAGAILSQESFVNTPNLERHDLRGVQLPEDLSGVRFNKTTIDLRQVQWVIERGGCLAGAIIGQEEFEYIFNLEAAKRPSLRGVMLHKVQLAEMDLTEWDLSGVDFILASLQGAILRRTNLVGARLPGDLRGVDFSETIIDLKQLRSIQLLGCSPQGAILTRESFEKIPNVNIFDLRGVRLPEDLSGINFYRIKLDSEQLRWVVAHGGRLSGVAVGREELEYILSLDKTIRPRLGDLVLEGADLSGMDLSGMDLSHINLSQSKLHGACLRGTNLINTILPANLAGVDFSGAIINIKQLLWIQQHGGSQQGAVLAEAFITDASGLQNLDLRGVQLPKNVANISFKGTWLDTAQVRWIIERGGNLSGAILKEVDLREMPLQSDVLMGTDLRGAMLPDDMQGLKLIDCKLDRAEILWIVSHKGSLVGVDLSDRDLAGIEIPVGTDLSQANLTATNLKGAIMSGIKLDQAKMTGACLDEADFTNTDFGAKSIKFASARNARFDGARAYFVNFRHANITGASFEGAGVHVRYLIKIMTQGGKFTQIRLLTEESTYITRSREEAEQSNKN